MKTINQACELKYQICFEAIIDRIDKEKKPVTNQELLEICRPLTDFLNGESNPQTFGFKITNANLAQPGANHSPAIFHAARHRYSAYSHFEYTGRRNCPRAVCRNWEFGGLGESARGKSSDQRN